MKYKLNYNFLILEYKDLYNTIIEIEEEWDLEVICKGFLKLLKDIIVIIYKQNRMFLDEGILNKEIINELEDKKLVPTEIIKIMRAFEDNINLLMGVGHELSELNKVNEAKELNDLSELNKVNEVNELNDLNELNQANETNKLKDLNEINERNKAAEINELNDLSELNEANEKVNDNIIESDDFAKIYEVIVWFVINYGEEDYSLFFNKLNIEEKRIFTKYLQDDKINMNKYKEFVKNDKVVANNYDEENEEDEEDEYDNEIDESIELVDKGESYYFGKGLDKNDYRARKYFKKAAELGNQYGQVYLGLFFEKGIAGEKDIKKAMYWYKKAAANENAFAQYSIGYLYFNGKEIEQNYEYAFNWYKKSAENGFPAAQHALAYLYKMGEGCEESLHKAYYWLEKAAENDFEDSFYVLGASYLEGEGVELNYKKAYRYLSKAAEVKNENAIESLGDMYYSGLYVDEDKNKAFKLYKESLKLGNTDLYYKLGKIYEAEGKSKLALRHYKKGHENNDIRATQKLGVMYYNGEIVDRDVDKSLEYMEIASKEGAPHALYVMGIAYLITDEKLGVKYLKEAYKLGSIHAAEALANELLMEVLNDKKIDEKELLEYIKKAMDEDLEDAIYYYGLVNAYGIGLKKNNEEAFKYFKIAAEKGCEKAIIKIANWYKHGIYVRPSPYEAIQWYKKAAEKFNSEAIASIVEIYEKGIGINPDYKRAFEGVKLLRETNIVEGNLKTAYYYIEGIGTEIDIEKAEKLIEETMELDEGKTLNFLGELAESEIYKKGKTKAITYYIQAVENGCSEAISNIEYYLYKKNKKDKSNKNNKSNNRNKNNNINNNEDSIVEYNEIYKYPFQLGKENYLKAMGIFNKGKENKNPIEIENGIKELKRSVKRGFYPAIIDIIKYYEGEEPTRDNLINLSKYKQKAVYYNIEILK